MNVGSDSAWSSYPTSYSLFSASSSWLLVKQNFLVYKMGIVMRGSNEVTYLGVHGIFHVQFGTMWWPSWMKKLKRADWSQEQNLRDLIPRLVFSLPTHSHTHTLIHILVISTEETVWKWMQCNPLPPFKVTLQFRNFWPRWRFFPPKSTLFCVQSIMREIFKRKNWLILMDLQVKPHAKLPLKS